MTIRIQLTPVLSCIKLQRNPGTNDLQSEFLNKVRICGIQNAAVEATVIIQQLQRIT